MTRYDNHSFMESSITRYCYYRYFMDNEFLIVTVSWQLSFEIHINTSERTRKSTLGFFLTFGLTKVPLHQIKIQWTGNLPERSSRGAKNVFIDEVKNFFWIQICKFSPTTNKEKRNMTFLCRNIPLYFMCIPNNTEATITSSMERRYTRSAHPPNIYNILYWKKEELWRDNNLKFLNKWLKGMGVW